MTTMFTENYKEIAMLKRSIEGLKSYITEIEKSKRYSEKTKAHKLETAKQSLAHEEKELAKALAK